MISGTSRNLNPMKPSVTLTIPTKNRLPFLRQTLQDALDQDYENLEILVSDNGSSDETQKVVETMARENPRLRYRRNPSTVPIITHFNQCLEAATGELFVLVSDDDRINRSFVSALSKGLTGNKRATVAVPTNAIINKSGDLIRTLPLPAKTVWQGIDFVTEWLWKIHDLPVANLLTVMGYTRSMRKFGYQPFANGLNSDNLLFLQLALAGEVTFCQEAIFYWRDHESQQGRTTPVRLVDKAGQQFLSFVKADANLPHQFLAQPPSQQKLVREGIRQMNAEAHLYGIDFFQKPFNPQTLKHLLCSNMNPVLLRLVLRFYYRRARSRFFRKTMSSATT